MKSDGRSDDEYKTNTEKKNKKKNKKNKIKGGSSAWERLRRETGEDLRFYGR